MRRMLSCGDRIGNRTREDTLDRLMERIDATPPEIAPVVRREGVMTNDFLRIGRRI